MRAFVTGATGFLGSHLVRALVTRGDSVVALVRDRKKAAVLPRGVELHIGDLTDADALRELGGPFDAIFHLGAALSGDWAYHKRVTVEGTRRLLDFAAECGLARLVLVSSLAIYDKQHLKSYDAINENSKLFNSLEAGGPYAWGKLEAERLVAERAERAGIEYVIARPGLIYGPGHTAFTHLGPKLGRFRFPIGGASVRLPLVHVDSVVDALIRLAEMPGLNGRAFNIVDDEQPSKGMYVKALSQASGSKMRAMGVPAGPFIAAAKTVQRLKRGGRFKMLPGPSPEKIRSRTIECRYDCAALRNAVAWKPACTLEEGIRRSLKPLTVRPEAKVERVGIIGAGRMADYHMRGLRLVPGIRVTGVLDTNLAAAKAVAERHQIPLATDSVERFYEEAKPDVVHILTPPQSHAMLAHEAISRGCHVLLEKPMVLSLEEADALQDAARSRGVTVAVNHNYVPDPRVRRARSMIASGAIGELVHIDLTWGFDIRRFKHALPSEETAGTWATELPGGLLEDLIPHPLSLVLALASEEMEPRWWHTFRSGRLPYPCEDEVRMAFAGRHATANLTVSLSAKPDDLIVTVYGSRATLKVDIHNMIFVRGRLMKGPKAISRGLYVVSGNARGLLQTARNTLLLAMKRAEMPASVAHLVREHYTALRSGCPLPTGIDEGRRVVALTRLLWPQRAGEEESWAAAGLGQLQDGLDPGSGAATLVSAQGRNEAGRRT